MASCVAVLCAYWPQRIRNIHESVNALLNGTFVPDEIIIINNNSDFHLSASDFPPSVEVINSSGNYTSRSKYPIALMRPAEYYALLDDDVLVSRKTLEAFLKYASPGCALSDLGVKLTSNDITAGTVVSARDINDATRVDAFIGRFQLLSFGAIVRLLSAEEKVRVPNLPLYNSVGEDILVAACNNQSYVIPLDRDSWVKDAFQGDSAMQHDYGYYEFRNLFNYQMREILGLPVFDGIPGIGEDDQRAIGMYLDKVLARDLGELQ